MAKICEMIKKVAIIGAGGLGSRHLQGIAKSKQDLAIEIVEPSKVAQNVAKKRYYEVKTNPDQSISFHNSIDALSDKLDLVIVATNADIRAQVVTALLTTKEVCNLILEKVLFQSVQEYYAIEALLKAKEIKCWVNHPRRLFPFYRQLKQKLSGSSRVEYIFKGSQWGMGCNALHLIDHLSFLTNNDDLSFSKMELTDVYNSKRQGFVDFNGEITGKLGNHNFSLFSYQDKSPDYFIINSDDLVAFIDESNGYVRMAERENAWAWQVYNTKIVYYQSELTHLLAEDILYHSKCDLPTYSQGMKLHIPFVELVLNRLNQHTDNTYQKCPIT